MPLNLGPLRFLLHFSTCSLQFQGSASTYLTTASGQIISLMYSLIIFDLALYMYVRLLKASLN